jgi:hypothetical protein
VTRDFPSRQGIESNRNAHTDTDVRVGFLGNLKINAQVVRCDEFENRRTRHDPFAGIARFSADGSRERRFQHVAFEQRTVAADFSKAPFDRRRIHFDFGLAPAHLGLRYCAVDFEALRFGKPALGIVQPGAYFVQARTRALQGNGTQFLVEREEILARFHDVTDLDMHRDDPPGDLGRELRDTRRGDAASHGDLLYDGRTAR